MTPVALLSSATSIAFCASISTKSYWQKGWTVVAWVMPLLFIWLQLRLEVQKKVNTFVCWRGLLELDFKNLKVLLESTYLLRLYNYFRLLLICRSDMIVNIFPSKIVLLLFTFISLRIISVYDDQSNLDKRSILRLNDFFIAGQ